MLISLLLIVIINEFCLLFLYFTLIFGILPELLLLVLNILLPLSMAIIDVYRLGS